MESTRPGQLLNQDTFFVGTLKGVGKLYLHAVAEAAVSVLHNDVIPFYQKLGINIEAVLTDNGREFCGTEAHPYQIYLALNEIELRRPRTKGFVERFNRTVLDEFFRTKFYEH